MDAADRADVIEAIKVVVNETAQLFARVITIAERLDVRISALESGRSVSDIELQRAMEARDRSPD
jgi:hypothetical protein